VIVSEDKIRIIGSNENIRSTFGPKGQPTPVVSTRCRIGNVCHDWNDVFLFSREGAQPLDIAIKHRNLPPSRQEYSAQAGPIPFAAPEMIHWEIRQASCFRHFGQKCKGLGKTLD
jgi:hypothetical protein